ncbi:accessory factor UbiK family protein [Candidatus Legionella polyplacis]|uniref:Accessory factor UbiK family protein n=1 Tax=Candidatus Legionella polyplacis TaxID=2005262 RepID=A0ABZ2GXH5_9GAMM
MLENNFYKKLKSTIQNILLRLNIVTREEFEIQTKVLKKTREKVELLQQQLEDFIKKTKSSNKLK